jgi:hypothetical protein
MELSDRVHIPPPPGRVADPDAWGATEILKKSHVKLPLKLTLKIF